MHYFPVKHRLLVEKASRKIPGNGPPMRLHKRKTRKRHTS